MSDTSCLHLTHCPTLRNGGHTGNFKVTIRSHTRLLLSMDRRIVLILLPLQPRIGFCGTHLHGFAAITRGASFEKTQFPFTWFRIRATMSRYPKVHGPFVMSGLQTQSILRLVRPTITQAHGLFLRGRICLLMISSIRTLFLHGEYLYEEAQTTLRRIRLSLRRQYRPPTSSCRIVLVTSM